MKSAKTLLGMLAILAFGACTFTACDDDDDPSFETATVSNTELLSVLKDAKYGLTFNENNELVLDDAALAITSLDLSGTKISADALAGLSVLPNLTEVNLANNGYGDTFDFANLPAQITAIDLTGNEIYNYDNLVKVTVAENGDETVDNLRTITKLYLPNEAKNNIAQLMRFYRQNKTAIEDGTMDVKMANSDGDLEVYNTLREIPDEVLRAYLNGSDTFSELFDGDKIDISKHLSNAQKVNSIYLNEWFVTDFSKLANLDGLQYIVNNPYWEGTYLTMAFSSEIALPRLSIGSTVTTVIIENADASMGFDLADANSLYYISLTSVSGIESVNLSSNPVWGQRGADVEDDAMLGSRLILLDCTDVAEVKIPAVETLRANEVRLEYLTSLKSLDLSAIQMVTTLAIGDLASNADLKYPVLKEYGVYKCTYFACSTATYELESTKTFVATYKDNMKSDNLNCSKNSAASWE